MSSSRYDAIDLIPKLLSSSAVFYIPHCNIIFSTACCDSSKGNGFKLKQGRLRSDKRRWFLQSGWRNTGRGCAERWWIAHPWKHWMGLWEPDLVEDVPTHCRGNENRWPSQTPSKRFYGSVIILWAATIFLLLDPRFLSYFPTPR